MIRRTLAVLAVLVMFSVATPAQAGGPTSVLLSAPPHVVAFGYDDTQYVDLLRLIDAANTRTMPGDTDHAHGSFVRASWLIHDMSVWRLDIIYPDAPGGPWISTSEAKDGSAELSAPVWHTAADPVALIKLLNSMELLRGQRNGEQPVGGPTTVPQAVPAPVPQTAAPVASVSAFTGWRWSVPGLLLGVVLTVGWFSWRARSSGSR